MWFEIVLFLLLQPGLLLTIPPVGKKVFMSGKTSLNAIVLHALIFAAILYFKSSIPILRDFEGFQAANANKTFSKCNGRPTSNIKDDCITNLRAKIADGVNASYNASSNYIPLSSREAVVSALELIHHDIDGINNAFTEISNLPPLYGPNSDIKSRLIAVPDRAKHYNNLVKQVNDTKLAADDALKKYNEFLTALDDNSSTVSVVVSKAAQAYTALNELQQLIRGWPQRGGHFNYADKTVKTIVFNRSLHRFNFDQIFRASNPPGVANSIREAVLAIRDELWSYKKESNKNAA